MGRATASYLSFPPLKFADIPAGTLGSWAALPQAGWAQIVAVIAILDNSLFAQTDGAPGDAWATASRGCAMTIPASGVQAERGAQQRPRGDDGHLRHDDPRGPDRQPDLADHIRARPLPDAAFPHADRVDAERALRHSLSKTCASNCTQLQHGPYYYGPARRAPVPTGHLSTDHSSSSSITARRLRAPASACARAHRCSRRRHRPPRRHPRHRRRRSPRRRMHRTEEALHRRRLRGVLGGARSPPRRARRGGRHHLVE